MLNRLGLSCALACLFLGGVLFSEATLTSDATQTARLVGGAFLLALGLVTICLIAKDWWTWRKHHKSLERSVADQSVRIR